MAEAGNEMWERLAAQSEVISRKPLCLLAVLDGPGQAAALRETWQELLPQGRVAVAGLTAEENWEGTAALLAPLFSKLVAVTPDHSRAVDGKTLAEAAGKFCRQVYAAQTCGEALAAALKDMARGDALIVWGCPALAEEIREQLQGKMDNLKSR